MLWLRAWHLWASLGGSGRQAPTCLSLGAFVAWNILTEGNFNQDAHLGWRLTKPELAKRAAAAAAAVEAAKGTQETLRRGF